VAFALAGLLQAAWLRSRWSAWLQVPIDGGRTLGGKRVFGDNKTWRGFFMAPAAGAAFLGLSLTPGWGGLWPLTPGQYGLLGLWAGFGFMAAELPNSFVKRRLGIAPGAAPQRPAAKLFCFLADRLDSIAGGLLAVAVVVPVPWQVGVYVLPVAPLLHWSFSLLLFHLGVKARPA
jgi:CDP-2,3-bis-(O-geranylgeranyl)-sn-glycerol synthase